MVRKVLTIQSESNPQSPHKISWDTVVHACNPNAGEAETGRTLMLTVWLVLLFGELKASEKPYLKKPKTSINTKKPKGVGWRLSSAVKEFLLLL